MKKNKDLIKRFFCRFWLLPAAGILLAAAMTVSVQGNFGGFAVNADPDGYDSDFADWNENIQGTEDVMDWGFTSPDSLPDPGSAESSNEPAASVSSSPTPTPVPSPAPTILPSPAPTPEVSSALAVTLPAENPAVPLDSGNLVPAVCLEPTALSVRKWDNVPSGRLRIRLDGDKILGVFSVRLNNMETEWSLKDGSILVEIPGESKENHLEVACLSLRSRIFGVDERRKECYTIH